MARLRVLICGAGIAGNALAFWLSRHRDIFDVTVVEHFPELRVNGLQVDIRGHGIAVTQRMGLEDAIRARCVPELGIQLIDRSGRQWGYMPANTSGHGAQSFTSEFEIVRGDLCQIFYDEASAKDNVKYKFGTSATSYNDEENGPIEVQFADGTSGTYDLLVGTDGLHSRTRKMMLAFDSGTPDAFYPLDQYIAYLRVPSEAKEGEDYVASAYVAPQGRFILTRRHNRHQLQVYLTGSNLSKRLDNVTRGDTAAEKEAFALEFRGAGWRADELVDLLLESDDFYCQREGFVKLERWSRGRVTLLGDAGYCSSTNGYGTSSVLVGAYILAGELVRHAGGDISTTASQDGGLKAALDAYEQKLRPLVTLLQEDLSAEKGYFDDFELKAWHIWILYWFAWFASMLRLYKLAALFEDRGMKSWELPDYPELKLDIPKGDDG